VIPRSIPVLPSRRQARRRRYSRLQRLLLASLLLGPGLCGAATLKVFVSVLPQKTFVEKVGGEHVQVEVMVRSGYSPATYDPSPKQIADLADADLYVRTGVPFEQSWMGRTTRAAMPSSPPSSIGSTGK
jgi:zinc transport system substrate-binding protein